MSYTFISGATGGIGKSFSKICAQKGYDLFLTGRSKEKLENLIVELRIINPNIEILYFACDLSNEDERKNMFSFVDKSGVLFNRIINVAGVDTQKAFNEYTDEKVLFQLRVNVESTIMVTKFLLTKKDKDLEIITIGSMSGVSPMPYFAIYSATKCMLLNFFTALYYELKKDKVKITTVLPGGVYTRQDILEEIKSQGLWGKLTAKTPDYVAEKSLIAVKKNKRKYIPGFFNKLLYFLILVAPKGIVLKYIAKRWKTHSKDAFI